jgi:hypothetical protein
MASSKPSVCQSLVIRHQVPFPPVADLIHARGADNVLPLTNGKYPFNNSTMQYAAAAIPLIPTPPLSAIIAGINATAPRMIGDSIALAYAARYFTPSGALKIPTLTLHNR